MINTETKTEETAAKEIAVPGQILAEGLEFVPGSNVIREKDKLIATKVGIINTTGRIIKIIPLAGKYIPKAGDNVIGKVTSAGLNGWRIDIGWAFEANLSLKDGTTEFVDKGADLTKYFDNGDYVLTQISKVISKGRLIDLNMKGPGLKKLGPGRLVHVTPAKIPRVIGKQGSMVTMIKEATKTRIVVGQNGIVWIAGEEPHLEIKAVEAIRKIEAESHLSGLTDRIKAFLEQH